MVWMFGPVGRGQDVTIVVRVVLGWSDGTAWYSSQFLLISFAIVFSTDICLHRHGYIAIFVEGSFVFSFSIIEGSALVCIEAFILLHCIIFQCIHTLYGCIIVHSVYVYVYSV